MIKLLKGSDLKPKQKLLLKAAKEAIKKGQVVVYNSRTKSNHTYKEIDYINAIKPPTYNNLNIEEIIEPSSSTNDTIPNISIPKKEERNKYDNAEF